MFTKPLTRAPRYILMKSLSLEIGRNYLHDHIFYTRFYHIYNDKNFIPKYPNNTPLDSVLTSRTSRRLLEKKAPVNIFVGTVPSAEKYCCK